MTVIIPFCEMNGTIIVPLLISGKESSSGLRHLQMIHV